MHGLRFYIDYTYHFLTSHSRHGTHSPFVYRLVDEVIYAPRKRQESPHKVERLISRLVSRFNPGDVYRLGNPLPSHPLNFVIADGNDAELLASQLSQLWPQLHVDSVLVLTGIYRDRRIKALWHTLRERSDVTVTIDLFHLGLVFFRKGQAKEDFRIRF